MTGGAATGPGQPPAGGGWRPRAVIAVLRRRARLMTDIRDFFASRGVLEVETPGASVAAATDPHLHSIPLATVSGTRFLHTSPEFPMKRLLAAGSGPIWQACRVFRDGEAGRRHNPEFSMLEWYRPGFGQDALITEVAALLAHVGVPGQVDGTVSYGEVFSRHAGVDPLTASDVELAECAREHGLDVTGLTGAECRDLLFSEVVTASFSPDSVVFVDRFPAEQAALARLCADDPRCAQRFECFGGPLELANGYVELTDSEEQRRRFERDNRAREAAGLPAMPMDERLLAGLAAGMPDSSGVALGLDRLLMLLTGSADIADVLAFPWEQA